MSTVIANEQRGAWEKRFNEAIGQKHDGTLRKLVQASRKDHREFTEKQAELLRKHGVSL